MASKRVKQKVKASVSNQSVIVTALQNKGLFLFGILGIMLIISAGIVLQKSTFNAVVGRQAEEAVPAPYPFYDLTIPYLREQTFISSLNEIEEVSRTVDYISYVTSFTSDGFKVNGLLTQPIGEPPVDGWPAVVFIHGYIPPSQYTTLGASYSTYVDYLARNGFVVFKIDLRGHGDSEGEPGGAYYSSDYVRDSLHAYTALQRADFVNPQKIGLWGHSMAGNISLRTIATKPEIPAVVIWAGAGYTYADLLSYRISDTSFDPNQSNSTRLRKREQLRKLYGDPDASKPFWQQLAPINYLNDINGAIQLHHAADDSVVDVRYSRDLSKLLGKTSVPHEFHEYETGEHNIADANFDTAMQRTVDFYKKYL